MAPPTLHGRPLAVLTQVAKSQGVRPYKGTERIDPIGDAGLGACTLAVALAFSDDITQKPNKFEPQRRNTTTRSEGRAQDLEGLLACDPRVLAGALICAGHCQAGLPS